MPERIQKSPDSPRRIHVDVAHTSTYKQYARLAVNMGMTLNQVGQQLFADWFDLNQGLLDERNAS